MNRLLIANRGEIARRIIRTARAMDIATVAVFSDADADAPHVREADTAIPIGPSAAAESYLRHDRILDAARTAGADAIHPGYGFLSENAAFAEAVVDAGLIWVGPPAAAIEAMGLKDAAKRRMKAAGVPVTPGYQGDDQTLARLEAAARQICYPLLIKAVAGGGGKGMRRVDGEAEFAEALVAAQREAERAFGNGQVLIEKMIVAARHVEVQVFADSHGNVVHLHERDCSLQRRHQKVIEEAPAPGLSERLRHTLGVAAVTAAMAIDYQGAGTIEFIVDLQDRDAAGDPKFYFMEMNTRLQVEHPVTEAITGVDLVEWQLRVARGEALPLAQRQIGVTGHAAEARLYAEDADRGFLPQTGRARRVEFPVGPGVRVDSGVESGGEISPFYDPMIAKIIAYGPDRATALARLTSALDATVIEGVTTNRGFLARLASHPAFLAGEISTAFIADHAAALAPPAATPRAIVALAGLAVAARPPIPGPFAAAGAFRLNLAASRTVELWEGAAYHRITVTDAEVTGLGDAIGFSRLPAAGGGVAATLDGVPWRAVVVESEGAVELRHAGATYRLATTAPRAATVAGPSDGRIVAPMPGRVLQLLVKPGQKVAAGDRLLVLEAMKMEHRLVAPGPALVARVAVMEGEQVSEGAILLMLEPAGDQTP